MREVININKNWLFSKKEQPVPKTLPEDWESVNLPHTWNGTDGQDGGNDYYRGKCCYVKLLKKADLGEKPVHYIQFDGVNSSAEVWWNGEKIGSHDGGYSAFRVRIPEISDENILTVYADNSPNDTVYPQVADFTFYGGIYRDVTVIGVDESHFDLEFYGSSGIMITPKVSGLSAAVNITARVTNPQDCSVRFVVTDADKKPVGEKNVDASDGKTVIEIENAHLWNGTQDPYLYSLTAELLKDGEKTDEISVRFGCRSFSIDPQKGFILNGKPCPLHGVSRHQDRPGIGNALTEKEHREDMDLICELGANTIRLAHYQHSSVFYGLCDERGMAVWAEIPYISRHMPGGRENTVSQMKELIYQNINHPSIIVWGLSNEITMNGASDSSLIENHRMLNDLVHKIDPTRPTTIAVLSMCDPGEEYVRIPDVLSYNHYFGWYGGKTDMYGPWFDKFHKKYPDRAVGMSEYRTRTASKLSGGQKQRIAIAGVLAMRPDILILDESTSMLDPNGRKDVMGVAKSLNEQGITVINITHNMEEAALADRIIVLRKGRIAIDGTPKEVFSSGILEACGLTLPPVSALSRELASKGFAFDGVVIDEKELVEKVCLQLK